MITDSNRIFPPPLIVEEEFVSRAAADNAAARGVLLEESDEIDCDQHKAVLDFRAATLSVLRVGANDVASGDGQQFFEMARFFVEQHSDMSILPAASANGEATVLICSSTENRGIPGGRVEHYSANGALLSERRWTDRAPRSAVASPLFFGRRFVAIERTTHAGLDFAVLVVDADDLSRDVLTLSSHSSSSVYFPRFFVTLDGTLMLSVCIRTISSLAPPECHLYAFDRAAGTFAHALTVDHAALGVAAERLRFGVNGVDFVDGRLIVLPRRPHVNYSIVVARIERADQSDGSPGWRLGDVARLQLSELDRTKHLDVSPCGRLLTVSEVVISGGRFRALEGLYSANDILTAADGARVDSVGRWERDALPPALEFGMPVQPALHRMHFADIRDGRCRTDVDVPLIIRAEWHQGYGSRRDTPCRFHRRIAGTLVATHQLSRADLDDDGVRWMRIANHDRVVIVLNSGKRRIFSLANVDRNEIEQENQQQQQQQRRRLYQRGQHHSTAFTDPLWRRDALFSIFDEDELEREEAEEVERAARKAERAQRHRRRQEQIAARFIAQREGREEEVIDE